MHFLRLQASATQTHSFSTFYQQASLCSQHDSYHHHHHLGPSTRVCSILVSFPEAVLGASALPKLAGAFAPYLARLYRTGIMHSASTFLIYFAVLSLFGIAAVSLSGKQVCVIAVLRYWSPRERPLMYQNVSSSIVYRLNHWTRLRLSQEELLHAAIYCLADCASQYGFILSSAGLETRRRLREIHDQIMYAVYATWALMTQWIRQQREDTMREGLLKAHRV